MGFDLIYQSPFFWFTFISFFFSIALNTIFKKRKKHQDSEKFNNKKKIQILLYFTLALVFFICAVLVCSAEKIKDEKLLYFLIFLTTIFFLGIRFKKAFGIPFLTVGIALIISLMLFIQSLIAFTGETEIVKIQVLSIEDESMNLLLDFPKGEDKRIGLKGDMFAVNIKVVILDDFLVFMGAKTLYRFTGISSYQEDKKTEIDRQMEIYPFEKPKGIPEFIYRFFVENESWLPGIKSVQAVTVKKKAEIFQGYSVRVQYDSAAEIVKIDSIHTN